VPRIATSEWNCKCWILLIYCLLDKALIVCVRFIQRVRVVLVLLNRVFNWSKCEVASCAGLFNSIWFSSSLNSTKALAEFGAIWKGELKLEALLMRLEVVRQGFVDLVKR
jgi:hypothetical protein